MDINELALYRWFQGYAHGITTGDKPEDYLCHISVDYGYEAGSTRHHLNSFSADFVGDKKRDDYLFNGLDALDVYAEEE